MSQVERVKLGAEVVELITPIPPRVRRLLRELIRWDTDDPLIVESICGAALGLCAPKIHDQKVAEFRADPLGYGEQVIAQLGETFPAEDILAAGSVALGRCTRTVTSSEELEEAVGE